MATPDAPISVLILHRVGNPSCAPRFLRSHAMSFAESIGAARCLFHDISLPLPAYVREATFDGVFLDVTMLGARWRGAAAYREVREHYAFVRDLNAVKIAFPQDEYDCHELLDEWLCEWRVDVVMSVLDRNHEVLYPKYLLQGRIEVGFTGYVDQRLLSFPTRPHATRRIDIGYRAKRLPPYFGHIGETKWTIGRDVLARSRGTDLAVDIAVGDAATIAGEGWLDFVASCRFMLGSNSGSSLRDPRGEIQSRVKHHMSRHPRAAFAEVEAACFPGLDGVHEFTAISPRNLEAAALGTGQLLVDGEYSGILKPGEHYLALRPDASNFDEVADAMSDAPAIEAMIRRCREAILDEPRLRYESRNRTLADLVVRGLPPSGPRMTPAAADALLAQYQHDMCKRYSGLWRQQAIAHTVRRCVDAAPAQIGRVLRRLASAVRR